MSLVRMLFGIVLTIVLAPLPTVYSSQRRSTNEKVVSEKTLIGQLLNVDAKARILSVRGPDHKEAIFNYNDDTQVLGPDKTVNGLISKIEAQLRISYREDQGVKVATRIELIEKQ